MPPWAAGTPVPIGPNIAMQADQSATKDRRKGQDGG